MQEIALIIILLAVVTALAEVTDKVKIPYPILLVMAGIGIGLFPGLPSVTLDPEIIFLVFLPPVLYAAAWETSWPDFKKAKRPITLLAIGCVIFTTCAVAWVAHAFIPQLGWPEAFVLGAIISPPDAVAATSATKGLNLPKRIITILEGESLVNDATGLIAYRYAVAAVASGTFSILAAGVNFLLVAGAGILIGFVVAIVFKWIQKITPDNPTNDTTLTLLAPYVAYLSAEAIHVSGVLAVVVAGLHLSWNASTIFSKQSRLQAVSAWNTIIFLLNGVIFILIGLQLDDIVNSIHGVPPTALLIYGAVVSAAVIIGRIIWVYPATYIPRLSRKVRRNEPRPSLRSVAIVSWSGMRGVVSLAAALALPLTVNGKAFPHRELIIFLTFCVIFSTLVLQGLTLRPLINWLGVKSDGSEHRNEMEARLRLLSGIIEHIEENYSLALSDEVLNQVKTKYEIRIQKIRKDVSRSAGGVILDAQQIQVFHRIQQEILEKERADAIKLRNEGTISDEVLRKIEYELDLEETRLMLESNV